MSGHPDTICALATPVGTAAIALVRLSGPEARRLATELAGGATPLPRLARHGDYRDRAGVVLDDVVCTFFAAPHSYSGEDTLEISAHGNPYLAQRILEDLCARGCRLAGPGEFTQRAFLHGRMDLSQAEAVMDLIHARGERALAMANQQLRGALGRHLTPLVDGLLGVLARVEAYIDFPEEDLPTEDRTHLLAELDRLQTDTGRLLATSHYGAMLRDGIKTVILGPTNAGKSSLLNRLVGHDRALVSPEPGTTRDFIEERIVIGPHAIRLIDTAGLNPNPGTVERLGIEQTFGRAAEADLILVVLDASAPFPTLPPALLPFLTAEKSLTVFNKLDLVGKMALPSPPVPSVPTVGVSALTGQGMDDLTQAIVRLADACQVSVGDDLIAVSARHAGALGRARSALQEARAKLTQDAPTELLASDLRTALDAYGEISGKVDNERMLDQLFATFCIGK
jgi:tRNA modification GTPase